MNWLEKFECANCNHIGPLNTRGRCEHCESNQVLSIERIGGRTVAVDVAYYMDFRLA